jgi:hypothetical protein
MPRIWSDLYGDRVWISPQRMDLGEPAMRDDEEVDPPAAEAPIADVVEPAVAPAPAAGAKRPSRLDHHIRGRHRGTIWLK